MRNELKIIQRDPQDKVLLELNRYITRAEKLLGEGKALRGPNLSPSERLARGEQFRSDTEEILRAGEPLQDKLKILSGKLTDLQEEREKVDFTLGLVARREKELARAEKASA